ncbi:MAG TPA: Smr/MutS family protein [Thermoanaerobaculia bacterium]|nr:Smr/MutS family protein [Thermoanaerobaculia bacterium]
MSDSTLSRLSAQALEFPSLLAVLAQLAATDLGRERVLALQPFADLPALLAHRERLQEAARLLVERPLVPEFELPLASLIERLATGRPPLEGIDLVRLAELVRTCRAAADLVRSADPPCPGLAAWTERLPDATALVRRIDKTLDRRGEVREDASPQLAALRREIRRVRERLYRDLGEFVTAHRDELSEETIPMRGGRLVLVLQAGARGRSGGLVHGRSATGKSYYFEPLQVVESNNNLQQAAEEEEAERRRILAELLAAARTALPELGEHARLLGELDLLQAAQRFGERAGGQLPEIGQRRQLKLVAARHPLLDPALADLRQAALGQRGHEGPIVPLNVQIGEIGETGPDRPGGSEARAAGKAAERRILVVTGPNAGGKTVALKTVGLLALAAQSGLPIPAAPGSRVPFLARLVATVGDDQDLLADRSTFSGRLLRLKEAWEGAGPDALILLDELGSGTDPQEGAALAVALLEELLRSGSLAVITTHLGELAAGALEMPGAGCAAMEFDPATGRPTFHLVPGPPGGSEALALARRLGLPARWVERAEARLGSEHRDLRRLLGEVEKLRQELAEARTRLAVEVADAEKLRRRLAAEETALAEERKAVARRGRAELDGFRRQTAERLREEVAQIERSFAEGRRRGLAAEALARLFESAPALADAAPEAAGPLQVGEPVRHSGLGWRGILRQLDGERAVVQVQGKRVRCRPEELVAETKVPAVAAPAAAAPAPWRSTRPARSVPSAPSAPGARRRAESAGSKVAGDLGDLEMAVSVAPELNLIGQRVEPALEELDGYLDRALLASRRQVRVVHGHGTGRLRQAIRQHLRVHAAVSEMRPGEPNEGGNGATVVTLRGATAS